MATPLFSPLRIGKQTFSNRIVVAPMCQYSAQDGTVGDWHIKHLGTLAGSGAGLVIVEATAVERAGRITHNCVGLYSDANAQALAHVLAFCRAAGAAGFGIQLAHAGRKASSRVPWEGGGRLPAGEDPWPTYAPSAVPELDASACTDADLERIRRAFVQAAQRAVAIGFSLIELHAAHGYLLHEFLSPLSNQRTDRYGGSLENRMRFPLEVVDAVRAVVPDDVALGVRLTGSDWVEGGITIEEAIAFSRQLRQHGAEFLDVTSGGLVPAGIPLSPGYQAPFAKAIKAEVDIPVTAVGLIVNPQQAQAILDTGEADAVALGRAFLDNPHWPYEAARQLGAKIAYPPQYARADPELWPGAALKQYGGVYGAG